MVEITGKVVQILPKTSGEGKNGAWTKLEFVIETFEQYPKKICIQAWNNNAVNFEQFYPVGTVVNASVDIESREWQGKWFTNIKAWKLTPANEPSVATAPQQTQVMSVLKGDDNPPMSDEEIYSNDPLPF